MKPEEVPQNIELNIPAFILWMVDKEARTHNTTRQRILEELIEFIYTGKTGTHNATEKQDIEG